MVISWRWNAPASRRPSLLIWEAKLNQEDVSAMCREHLTHLARRPSALFCTNGVTGLGALRGMAACGLSTPEDIAFVTFDEITAEDIFRPAITSVVQPAYEIGFRAAEILIERIHAGPAQGPRIEARLPATLKVRESSTAAAAVKSVAKRPALNDRMCAAGTEIILKLRSAF